MRPKNKNQKTFDILKSNKTLQLHGLNIAKKAMEAWDGHYRVNPYEEADERANMKHETLLK